MDDSPDNRKRLSPPGLRTFLAIADLWGLTEDERRIILGNPHHATYEYWCKLARKHRSFVLSVDELTRISAILGIHQALQILFSTEKDGIEWLRGPHQSPVFGGNAPLSVITGGTLDGLLLVRRYLDAEAFG